MLVSAIKIVEREDFFELQAEVKFEADWVWGKEPFRLWYRFPAAYQQFVNPQIGDAFLAAFLLPAMVLGESLEIQAPVSSHLLSAIPELQALYRRWEPKLSEIQILRPSSSPEINISEPRSRGLFFSLGVDSSYSLLKNMKRHPAGSKTITHLLTVQGFDVYLWESERYPAVLAHLKEVAAELNKELVVVATNLRDLTDRLVDWPRLHHGAALASVGLALDGKFNAIHIAASSTFDLLYPWGSHPVLDPLWSNGRLTFIHDGCEALRLDKIRWIAQSPVILNALRVCTSDQTTDIYNCGQCEKCLRTMISLHIVGALKRCRSLPSSIDLDLVRTMPLRVLPQKIQELISSLGSSEEDLAIQSALKECLERNEALVKP